MSRSPIVASSSRPLATAEPAAWRPTGSAWEGKESLDDTSLRVRLLLVEDDPVDRMAFERFVRQERQPFDYTIAKDLGEARACLEHESYDAVISDFHLPDGDALEVMALCVEAPVIVITGAGDEQTAVEAMRAGAFDYLIKDHERGYLTMLPVTVGNARRLQRAERHRQMLSQALMSLNDCVYITDMDDRILYVNESFRRTYGYTTEEILGHPSAELWAGANTTSLRPRGPHTLPLDGERGECRHRRKDGREIAMLLSRSPICDNSGTPVAVVTAVRDISERKRWEQRLQESEARYALAAAGANDGLWDWDLRTDEVYYSPRWKATLDYGDSEIGTTPQAWLDLVHPDDLGHLRTQLEAHRSGSTTHFENEHRMRAADGTYRWVQARGLAVRDGSGTAYRMAGSQRDITDRKKAEAELRYAALHDALTGLPNRTLFMDRLDHAIKRAKRRPEELFAVIFLDIDRFKVINDSLGHVAGDQLLVAIGRRLEACLRADDTVSRLGGDEFCLLLENLEDVRQIDRVADRIQRELEAPFTVKGREIFTTASLGIALSAPGYERPEDILRDADTAMYRAKSLGGIRQAVFDHEMHARAVSLLQQETELRRAVEREEFTVHYQPIVDFADGELVGFEALVRWCHPQRGLLSPAAFLPLAEETGLLSQIGNFVLHRACQELQCWKQRFPAAAALTVSVNLDAGQLSRAGLIDQVEDALMTSGLDARSLCLELTESMILTNTPVTSGLLAGLRERQIELHLDDFGTGYSCLAQLHRVPVDALKIDRSFVSPMKAASGELALVRAIIELARGLELQVIAEGVETEEQRDLLLGLGCGIGQGYLLSHPIAPEAVAEHLAAGPPFRFGPMGGGPRAEM